MGYTISWHPKNDSKQITDIFSYSSVIIAFLAILISDCLEARLLKLNLHDFKQDAQVCQISKKLLMLADFI